jgi:hypothetical protein
MRLERLEHFLAERDLARIARLRRATIPFTMFCRTTMRPATRSTSCQRSPISSPWRSPVRSANKIIVRHSSDAAMTKRSASSNVRKSNSGLGGFIHSMSGTVAIRSRFRAITNIRRKTVKMLLIDFAERYLGSSGVVVPRVRRVELPSFFSPARPSDPL